MVLFAAWAAQPPALAQTYIGGTSACQTWTDLRRSDRYAVEWNWIDGYVESLLVNDPRLTVHGNEIKPAYIVGWMDTYCQKNPATSLRDALKAFYAAQIERFKPPAH